jgi:hypothetical protein
MKIPINSSVALAMFPQPFHEAENLYFMHELKINKDGILQWYKKVDESPKGMHKLHKHTDLVTAINEATEQNKELIKNIFTLSLSDIEKSSLKLKVEKSITSLHRRLNEETLMLQEALKQHKNDKRPSIDETSVPDNNENIRNELLKVLNITPYIKIARINKHGVTLLFDNNKNKWIYAKHTKQTAIYCYREKIARGYGFSGVDHWGKTKAEIRSVLLPRANQLLQLASVKRMLDEALSKGVKVLVSGNFVFWFEEKDQIGWIVKVVKNSDSDNDSNILWTEGSILSKNHGRIVVLPYIKENGEHIQGHTKNAPHDGKAIPRHKNEYVELPFEMLNDDLMIGLFGELNYE